MDSSKIFAELTKKFDNLVKDWKLNNIGYYSSRIYGIEVHGLNLFFVTVNKFFNNNYNLILSKI